MKDKNYYINLRDKYLPIYLLLVIVAESPPVLGKYFYDPDGRVSEPLFRAIMHDVLNISPRDKLEGLEAFRDEGMLLVDATYQQVNKGFSKRQRQQVLRESYPELREDLRCIIGNKDIPILIIKANVCELLEPLLLRDSFKVLNKGQRVPFPSSGQQGRFRKIVWSLLKAYIASDYHFKGHTGGVNMTLHEAMRSILSKADGPLHPKDLADSINKLCLYHRKDGSPLRANQIRARARRYPQLFMITADIPKLIRLRRMARV